MIRGLTVFGTILVALALWVVLLGAESDRLILTPAPMINFVGSLPVAPGTPASRNYLDPAIEEEAARRIIPGSQHIWGDGILSPRPE